MRLRLALNFHPLQGWDSRLELRPTILDLHCELRQGASGSHSPGEESGGNCSLLGGYASTHPRAGAWDARGQQVSLPWSPPSEVLSPSTPARACSHHPALCRPAQPFLSTGPQLPLARTQLSRPDTDINANTWGFIGPECFRGGSRHHTPLMIGWGSI